MRFKPKIACLIALAFLLPYTAAATHANTPRTDSGVFNSDFTDLHDISSCDHVHIANGSLELNRSYADWVVPTGESPGVYWSYTTSQPASSWTSTDFDASAWSTGESPFGQDYNTHLNPNTPWTTSDIWIRHTFTPGFGISDVNRMTLRYWHDEDMEVYLNGQPLFSESGYVDSYHDIILDKSKFFLLNQGINVIAGHCHQTVYAQGIDLGLNIGVNVMSGNATSVVIKAPSGERFSTFDMDFIAGGTCQVQVSILNASTLSPFTGLSNQTEFPLDLSSLKSNSLRVLFNLLTSGSDIPKVNSWSVSWMPDIPFLASPLPDDTSFPEDTNLTRAVDLDNYFHDDIFPQSSLKYSVDYESAPKSLHAAIDGSYLSFFTPTPNWFGKANFLIGCTNGYHSVTSNRFNVTVTSVNDPPFLDSIPILQATQDIYFSYHFTAKDADVGTDPAERLEFTLNTTDFPLTLNGWMNFTPDNDMVGIHIMTLTVRDHAGATDSSPVVLIVLNTNDPPEEVGITSPLDGSSFNERVAINFTATAIDIDHDPLEFTWLDGGGNILAHGREVNITFTPGTYSIDVEVSDGIATVASSPITIHIININDPPSGAIIVLPVNGSAFNERTPVIFMACATDPDGDPLVYNWFDDTGSGIGTGEEFTLSTLAPGNHVVFFEVSDGKLKVRSASITFLINNINDPPEDVTILSPTNGTTLRHGEAVTFSATATDPDNDTLNFTWRDSKGNNLGYGENFTTNKLSLGNHIVHVDVSDGGFTVSSPSVTIKVSAPAGKKGFIPGFGVPIALFAIAVALLLFSPLSRRNENLY